MARSPTREEPAAFIEVDDPRLPRRLTQYLEDVVKQKTEALAAGIPKTIEDYRERVGEIRGIRTTIEICQQIEKNLSGER